MRSHGRARSPLPGLRLAEPETEMGSDELCCRGVAWDAEPAVAKVLLDRLSEPTAAEHVSEVRGRNESSLGAVLID